MSQLVSPNQVRFSLVDKSLTTSSLLKRFYTDTEDQKERWATLLGKLTSLKPMGTARSRSK